MTQTGSPRFLHWGWFIGWALLMMLLPALTDDIHAATVLTIWSILALSLGLMWGYAGILSFGHAAYFGLGAYTYAIASINLGESTGALILAILILCVFPELATWLPTRLMG